MLQRRGRNFLEAVLQGEFSSAQANEFIVLLARRLGREEILHPRLLLRLEGAEISSFLSVALLRDIVRNFPGLLDIRISAASWLLRLSVVFLRRFLAPGRTIDFVSDTAALSAEDATVSPAEIHPDQWLDPFTGLPVESRPQWRRIVNGQDSTTDFRVVGGNILVSRVQGDIAKLDTEGYFTAREKVLRDVGLREGVFAEVRDYSGCWGLPERGSRVEFFRRLQRSGESPVAWIAASPPPLLRIALVGTPHLMERATLAVRVSSHLGDAMRMARQALAGTVPRQQFPFGGMVPVRNVLRLLGELHWNDANPLGGRGWQESSIREALELVNADLGQMLASARQREDALETARVELEQALRDMRTSLAMAERERARTQKALAVRDDILDSVSHELRTPLNAILGMSELLRDSPDLSPDAKEWATYVHQGGQSLFRLLDPILEYGSIHAFRSGGGAAIDPRALLSGICSTVEDDLKRRAIEFQCRIAPDLPRTLLLDHGLLERVVGGMLAIASQSTLQGCVTLEARSRDGRFVVVVADTGRGMSTEELDRALDPSWKGKRNSGKDGRAPDLAVLRSLVNLGGGNFDVQSKLGSGTVFTVQLPVSSPD